MEGVDALVIGAGVVGLAVGRALAQSGRSVTVLEAKGGFGTQTSSRSSEVIHSGIYYRPGSLKARLCVAGRSQLYAYCMRYGLAHARCGKLIVATREEELNALRRLWTRGQENGVVGLCWLDARQARALEPELQCRAALYSPVTGIVDSHGLMLALLADIEEAGGLLVYRTRVLAMDTGSGALRVSMIDATGQSTAVVARTVVNAAGHGAVRLAHDTSGMPADLVPGEWFAKGQYFSLSGVRTPFSHLIYPVPEPGGLGVHLTLDLGGRARFGPDVHWVAGAADLDVNVADAAGFEERIRAYWPGLPDDALQPAYAGVRPKINGPGEPAADFLIQGPREHGVEGLVNLFGIESPGLTACLALGDEVLRCLRQGAA